RFTRSDGLRQLVFLTVRRVPEGPAERAKQLLERAGAAGTVTLAGTTASGPLEGPLAAAFAIAPTEPSWAGVLVLGPSAADVGAEAAALAAACQKNTPSVANGRVWDTTRRFSASIPAGHETTEVRGAGAVQAPGYTIRLSAVQPLGNRSLRDAAIEWLLPSGAVLTGTSSAAAAHGAWPVAIATGALVQGGVTYVIEVAAVDLGQGEVAGLATSSSSAAVSHARATLAEMLGSVTVEPKPTP
ncbi:MAG: hypothetical protein JNK82_26840, partial [Myxococcaceae bacterium]|nr:hypothetical protein [Myxococcaceae bacterium]